MLIKSRFLLIIIFVCIASTGGAADFSQPLSLADCVEIALENNIQLQRSSYDLASQQKSTTHALSGFLPTASVRSNLTRTGGEQFYGNLIADSDQSSSSLTLSATQNLFRGGYDFYNWKANKHAAKASELSHNFQIKGVIYEVQQKYFDLLKKQQLLSVREEDLALSNKQLELSEALNEVGSAAKSDVLRAKATVAQKKLALLNAKNDVNLSQADLSKTLAIDLNAEYTITDFISVKDIEPISVDVKAASSSALGSRLDLLASKASLASAQTSTKRARSGYMPSLTLYGNYGWRNNTVLEDAGETDNWVNTFDGTYDWSYGVQLDFTIFDGFSRETSFSQAKLSAKSSRKNLEQKKLDIAFEVKQAALNLETAYERIKQADESLKAAEEDLRLAEERYKLGVATIVDLNTAQLGYTNAKTSHVESVYDFELQKARLDYVVGK